MSPGSHVRTSIFYCFEDVLVRSKKLKSLRFVYIALYQEYWGWNCLEGNFVGTINMVKSSMVGLYLNYRFKYEQNHWNDV